MIIIGLTGSIASGKSTLCNLFKQKGIQVFDADGEVHKLYDGEAKHKISNFCKDCFVSDSIDRKILWEFIKDNPERIKQLEDIIHPLVELKRDQFLTTQRLLCSKISVLDIPLLIEKNIFLKVDVVLQIITKADIQKKRAISRGLSEEKYEKILSMQIPAVEKSKYAHFIIENNRDLLALEKQFASIYPALLSLV